MAAHEPRPYRCLDGPLEAGDEPLALAGGRPEARLEAARIALAASPLEAAAWGLLGHLLWEQAVRERSAAARSEAEQAFDLARMLAWPWAGEVPYAAEERMHGARLGERAESRWPARPTAATVRGSVLAFVAAADPAPEWVAALYETLDRAVPEQHAAARFWMAMAVCERLGDTEQRARFADRLRREPAAPTWPGQRGDLSEARRRTVAPVFGELRQAVLAEMMAGPLPAILDHPTVAAAADAWRSRDLPSAGALAALPPLARVLTPGRLTTVLALGAGSGDGWRAAVEAQAAGWPPVARALVTLALRPESAGFAVRLLLERVESLPLRARAAWLQAGCRVLHRHNGPARVDALQRLLSTFEDWPPARRRERLPLTLEAIRAWHGLSPDDHLDVLEQARRGWTSAAEHDQVGLAVVEALLASAAAGATGALDQARFYATRIDHTVARSAALLRVAAAMLPSAPDDAARVAAAALRRVRGQVTDQREQGVLQIEAARLMAAAHDADGVAVLLGWARRPQGCGRRGQLGADELVRALAEAGPRERAAWSAAESLAARLTGRAGWLAHLHLAARGPAGERAARLAAALSRPPRGARSPAESLLLALTTHGEARAATWPALLEALPAAESLRVRTASDGAAMVTAVSKLRTTTELDPFADWSATRTRPAERLLGRLLLGEGLQTLIERRADESAAGLAAELAASYAAQLARAAGDAREL